MVEAASTGSAVTDTRVSCFGEESQRSA
jgi:hypothetical protein